MHGRMNPGDPFPEPDDSHLTADDAHPGDTVPQPNDAFAKADVPFRGAGATGRSPPGLDRKPLKSLIDAIPAAVILVSADDHRLVMINQRSVEIYGANRIGMSMAEHFARIRPMKMDRTPYSLDEMPVMASLRQGMVVRHQEMIIHQANDQETMILASSSPIQDADGRITAAMVIFDDIGDLRRIETELCASHETGVRQAFLIRLMETLRPVVDPVEVQSIAARSLGEYLNVDRALYGELEDDGDHFVVRRDYHRPGLENFVGRYSLSRAKPELIAELRAGRTNVVNNVFTEIALTDTERQAYIDRELTAFIMVPLIRDGRMVSFLRVQCRKPHNWTKGDVALVEAVAEQTWAAVLQALVEERLRQSEAMFRTVLENSYDGISMLDLETGRTVYMSASQAAMTGYDLDELMRMSLEDSFARIHPDDRDFVYAEHRRMKSGLDETNEIEYRWQVKGGEFRWFGDRRKLVRDKQGRPTAIVGIVRDITPRKQAEEALRLADRNKNRFISILSHELRNPLASIVLANSLLDRTFGRADMAEREANMRRASEIIRRQTDQLTRLVDDLLDITRISESKIKLNKERIDLISAIERLLADLRAQFDAKAVALVAELPPGPLYIMADSTRLNQIVGNLLHNALKFTQADDRVSVTVQLDEDGQSVMIRVADTGMGIDQDIQETLFEPFTQAENTLVVAHGGLGLGLSIVKAMAELHGGRVEAASEGVGKGAAFTVHLPVGPES